MNKKLLTPLFVAASFLLIGCSTNEIVGRPSWIDQDIVVDPTGLKDNKMKEIYDAIKKLGDTNSTVLNKVMYQIAQKQLGHFDNWKDAKGVEHDGLMTIYNNIDNNAKVDQFVKDYPVYAVSEKEDEAYENGELRKLTADEKREISRGKIKGQYNAIIDRICELMYNEVKDGSYNSDDTMKLFSEERYVKHLKKELYQPVEPDNPDTYYDGKQVFTAKPTGANWFTFVNCTGGNGYLHIMTLVDSKWQFTELYYPKTKDGDDHGYIGRKILPDVYRELLIENYVREQRYTNLGRGYARKVEMVKIASGEYRTKISTMLTQYAKTYITGDGAKTGGTKAEEGNLDWINEAMIGIADAHDHPDAARLLGTNYGDFTPIKIPGTQTSISWKMKINKDGASTKTGYATPVYYGTKLGDIVEKFLKVFKLDYSSSGTEWGNFSITRKFTEEAKTAYNEFTNNDAYPIQIGVELKERELLSNDITQDGWFMKSGGLTDLTDEFRNQLFNISTSLVVDNDKKWEEDTSHPGWGNYESGDSARYFINQSNDKSAYVVRKTTGEDDAWNSVVLEDDSKNFFIVKVSEATSLAKLSLEDDRSYLVSKAGNNVYDSNIAMNEIIRGIAKQVASGDTYKKNAEQYYLMISNILFYDQSVYDYFKSQFPELFK